MCDIVTIEQCIYAQRLCIKENTKKKKEREAKKKEQKQIICLHTVGLSKLQYKDVFRKKKQHMHGCLKLAYMYKSHLDRQTDTYTQTNANTNAHIQHTLEKLHTYRTCVYEHIVSIDIRALTASINTCIH